ncbi:MAG: hypothetical protein ACLP9D_08955 [Candidatus Bathyarchaeia archaeon]
MIRTQFILSRNDSLSVEGEEMPTIIGLLFVGLVIRAILGAAIVVAVVFLAWKLGKLADAYTHELTIK